jgi:hypothetical protein
MRTKLENATLAYSIMYNNNNPVNFKIKKLSKKKKKKKSGVTITR